MIDSLLWRLNNVPVDLASDLVRPYRVDDKAMNQAFELKHGKSLKIFTMDKVSNGPFSEVKRKN